MLAKNIDAIDLQDIQTLLANEVIEGKGLEYKLELPSDSPEGKRKLLREICSFANTGGGDILFGVEALDGVPLSFPGLESPNEDVIKLRLENSCRDGIEPRIPHLGFRFVPVSETTSVLVVRIAKSWNAPHRLLQDGHFYARNSAGCYPLDVGEIRDAFTLSESVVERMRRFRAQRIGQIGGGETPVRMDLSAAKLIFHVIPLTAFMGRELIDIDRRRDVLNRTIPLGATGWSEKTNLDGFVTYTGPEDVDGESRAYTQVFRSGVIEAVEQFKSYEGHKLLWASFEADLLDGLPSFIQLLESVDIRPPYFLGIAFVSVTGYTFVAGSNRFMINRQPTADRDTLVLPEVQLGDREGDMQEAILGLSKMVWHAFSMTRPTNFDPRQ